MRLVLAPGRGRRGRVGWSVLVILAGLAGAAADEIVWRERSAQWQQQSTSLPQAQQLRQGLENAGLQLRVSDARSRELEHQIDTLNQRLRESQEELTFFRKTSDSRP